MSHSIVVYFSVFQPFWYGGTPPQNYITHFVQLECTLRGLRLRSAAAWLLGSRVRIPLGAWMFVSCVYMLSCPV
jgi:hypothetical protein